MQQSSQLVDTFWCYSADTSGNTHNHTGGELVDFAPSRNSSASRLKLTACSLREFGSCLQERWLFAVEVLEVSLLLQGWNGNIPLDTSLDYIGSTCHTANTTARDNVTVVGLEPNKTNDKQFSCGTATRLRCHQTYTKRTSVFCMAWCDCETYSAVG